MILRMFKLQLEQPKRRDWASTCFENLDELNLDVSLEEIKNMKKSKFKIMLDEKIALSAFAYIKEKQGSKGQEINLSELQTAEYLLPSSGLLLKDQQKVFSLRNRMVKIENNFSNIKQNCLCGEIESLQRIYTCKLFCENKDEEVTAFEEIYSNNISKQVKVLRRFENQFLKREKVIEENRRKLGNKTTPCDLSKDPLFSSFVESSNG